MELSEHIDQFLEFFRGKFPDAKEVSDPLHARIIWVTIVDTLSVAASPSLRDANKDRIVKFLECSSRWRHCNRVSLPQLKIALSGVAGSEQLLCEVDKRLSQCSSGEHYGPTSEPYDYELCRLVDTPALRKLVNRSRYKEMFYEYRNMLLHGFRPPGKAFDALTESESREPFYMGLGTIGEGGIISVTWELTFPLGLFKALVEDGMAALRQQLISENRNPYDAYEFGSDWFWSKRH